MQNRIAKVSTFLAALTVSVPTQALAFAERSGYWDHGWGWGHMAGGSLMMLLFWGGIILIVVLAVRGFGGRRSHGEAPQRSGKSAIEVLEDRFARGEIDKEEFEDRKRVLSS